MKRNHLSLLLTLLALLVPAPVAAQITITNVFTNGTTADADLVNADLSALGTQALNRTGGIITGNITASGGITIDGVDVGVQACIACTPTHSTLTLTSTGASALDVGGGINAGTGNVAIVDATGKIPAISSTTFASLSAANLTAIPAAQLTGTIADARLSANIPLINAANVFNGVTNSFASISASGSVSAGGAISTTGANFAVSGAGADLELGSVSAGNTPLLDFHSSGNNIDYDSRIIASAGTGVVGQGTLAITAGVLSISAQTVISLLQFGGAALVANTGVTGSLAATNFPGVTTTVHGWESVRLSDGTVAYVPVWK